MTEPELRSEASIAEPAVPVAISCRYRVVVTWDPVACWTGHVESDGHQLVEVTAPRLDLLEARSRAALVGIADRMAIALADVDIEPQVHPGIDEALEAGVAVGEVVGAMQRLNMFAADIAVVLQSRLTSTGEGSGEGLAVVANTEIAASGLGPWPDAVAFQCVALGADTSTWCRTCAQANHPPWIELTWGNTILISMGTVRCDHCGHHTSTSGQRADPRDAAPVPGPDGR